MLFFFFFKQKTAYEMRISDWSSDVCSSDLRWLGTENRQRLIDVLRCLVKRAGVVIALSQVQQHHADGGVVGGLDALEPFQRRVEQALRVGIAGQVRSEEHTSELQSLMRTSYAGFCLEKKTSDHGRAIKTENIQN